MRCTCTPERHSGRINLLCAENTQRTYACQPSGVWVPRYSGDIIITETIIVVEAASDSLEVQG